MVQLNILSGKTAGAMWIARRLPVRIGRAATNDLVLEENGIWDKHLVIELDRAREFVARSQGNALVTINGQTVQQTPLRSGDSIEMGSVKMRFWLSEIRQRSLRPREWLTWIGMALVCLGQIALIYWLLQ